MVIFFIVIISLADFLFKKKKHENEVKKQYKERV
jgi:hypothetical protein